MSSLATYCPSCGRALGPEQGAVCPQCLPADLPPASRADAPPWSLASAFLVWLTSVGLTLVVPNVVVIFYVLLVDQSLVGALRQGQLPPRVALIFIISAFVAHVLTLAISWRVVTGGGMRPFLATLGWGWVPQFRWAHAVGLACLMLVVGPLFEKVLPHGETELEKLLNISTSVRVGVALLAVLTAPLVEEIVYRGILYSALERAWGRVASVAVVALLFGAAHFHQYRESLAVIAAILLLSLVLTLLRAATRKLLPCVATHLIFNGIQAVVIIVHPAKAPDLTPTKEAMLAALHLLGLG